MKTKYLILNYVIYVIAISCLYLGFCFVGKEMYKNDKDMNKKNIRNFAYLGVTYCIIAVIHSIAIFSKYAYNSCSKQFFWIYPIFAIYVAVTIIIIYRMKKTKTIQILLLVNYIIQTIGSLLIVTINCYEESKSKSKSYEIVQNNYTYKYKIIQSKPKVNLTINPIGEKHTNTDQMIDKYLKEIAIKIDRKFPVQLSKIIANFFSKEVYKIQTKYTIHPQRFNNALQIPLFLGFEKRWTEKQTAVSGMIEIALRYCCLFLIQYFDDEDKWLCPNSIKHHKRQLNRTLSLNHVTSGQTIPSLFSYIDQRELDFYVTYEINCAYCDKFRVKLKFKFVIPLVFNTETDYIEIENANTSSIEWMESEVEKTLNSDHNKKIYDQLAKKLGGTNSHLEQQFKSFIDDIQQRRTYYQLIKPEQPEIKYDDSDDGSDIDD